MNKSQRYLIVCCAAGMAAGAGLRVVRERAMSAAPPAAVATTSVPPTGRPQNDPRDRAAGSRAEPRPTLEAVVAAEGWDQLFQLVAWLPAATTVELDRIFQTWATTPRFDFAASASPAASRRQQWIHAITSAATPSAQLTAALAIAREVDPADFPELLRIVRALPGDTLGALLQRAVLSRWLQHDPTAALAYAQTQDRQLLSETLGEWARREPAEAVAWFRNAPRRLVDAVAAADAFQNDPARAVAELTRIAAERRSEWAGWFVEAWALKDPEAARAWVATVPEAEGRADLLEKIDAILLPADSASPPSALETLVSRFAGGSGLAEDVTSEQRREVLEASARAPAENDAGGKVEELEAAADRQTAEPPARAATEPSSARKTSELAETVQTRADAGTASTTIRLAVETIPSLAPSTAARSHPMRCVRWFSS